MQIIVKFISINYVATNNKKIFDYIYKEYKDSTCYKNKIKYIYFIDVVSKVFSR